MTAGRFVTPFLIGLATLLAGGAAAFGLHQAGIVRIDLPREPAQVERIAPTFVEAKTVYLTGRNGSRSELAGRIAITRTGADGTTDLLFDERLGSESADIYLFGNQPPRMFRPLDADLSRDLVFLGENAVITGILPGITAFRDTVVPVPAGTPGVVVLEAGAVKRLGLQIGDQVGFMSDGSPSSLTTP